MVNVGDLAWTLFLLTKGPGPLSLVCLLSYIPFSFACDTALSLTSDARHGQERARGYVRPALAGAMRRFPLFLVATLFFWVVLQALAG